MKIWEIIKDPRCVEGCKIRDVSGSPTLTRNRQGWVDSSGNWAPISDGWLNTDFEFVEPEKPRREKIIAACDYINSKARFHNNHVLDLVELIRAELAETQEGFKVGDRVRCGDSNTTVRRIREYYDLGDGTNGWSADQLRKVTP
jgi:hypothetical protein